jgi:hypothetical protein
MSIKLVPKYNHEYIKQILSNRNTVSMLKSRIYKHNIYTLLRYAIIQCSNFKSEL